MMTKRFVKFPKNTLLSLHFLLFLKLILSRYEALHHRGPVKALPEPFLSLRVEPATQSLFVAATKAAGCMFMTQLGVTMANASCGDITLMSSMMRGEQRDLCLEVAGKLLD